MDGKRQKVLRVKKVEKNIGEAPCWDIQTSDHYVYLPEHDVTVSNCDDLVVALGSALMSIGIPIRIVGQSFAKTDSPTHVLLAIETPFGLQKIDPSSRRFRVGEFHPAVREWIIDPMASGAISLSGAGNFVGIGHAHVGVGAATPETTSEAVTAQLQSAVFSLETSVNRLGFSLANLQRSRAILAPRTPLDPEPYPITSVADFPVNGIWTAAMDTISYSVWNVGEQLLRIGQDALAGRRKVALDKENGDIQIESLPGDPWRMQTIAKKAEDAIVGVFNNVGRVISGFFLKSGKSIPVADVNTALQQVKSGQLQGVGAAQVIVGLIVGGVVTVSLVYAFTNYLNYLAVAADQANDKLEIEAIITGRMTVAQVTALREQRIQLRKAQAQVSQAAGDAFAKWWAAWGDTVKWAGGGALIIGGLYILTPALRAASVGYAERSRTRRMA
jgi:hypothetical protein